MTYWVVAVTDNSGLEVGRTKLPLASANHCESAFEAQDSEQMCSYPSRSAIVWSQRMSRNCFLS
jgi:hypothetical protein